MINILSINNNNGEDIGTNIKEYLLDSYYILVTIPTILHFLTHLILAAIQNTHECVYMCVYV